MIDEHDDAVNALAQKVANTAKDSSRAEDFYRAVTIGATGIPTDKLEKLTAAINGEAAALNVLKEVGVPIADIAANAYVYSSPVFNPPHATAYDERPPFKNRSKDSSDS